MSTFPSDEAMERAGALIAEVEKQTDRGVAIVCVAWVEEALVAAIHSFLRKDRKAWDRLFGTSRPLSPFAAKIDLARLLGMASSAVTSDLHAIREVRNQFAHSVLSGDNTPLSFSTQSVKDKCLALRCIKSEKIRNPRAAFIRACAVLNSDFAMLEFFGQEVSDGGALWQ